MELQDSKNKNEGFIYSYFFQVIDKDSNLKTDRLYSREDSMKYLPVELKPIIIPLVKKMTINLVNRIRPNIISSVSMEDLNDKTKIRFNELTQWFQDELGYKLQKRWTDKDNKECCLFIKKDNTDVELNEDTISEHYIFDFESRSRILEIANKELGESIKKTPLILHNSSKNGGKQYSEQ